MDGVSGTRAVGGDDAGADAVGEAKHCPVCRSRTPRPTSYSWDPFAVVRCGACRVWYLSPRLSEQAMNARYRDDDYFGGGASGYRDYAHQEPSLRVTFRRLLRILERRGLTGGSLLEVGCGFGYLLEEATPRFRRRVGTEMSPAAAARAEHRADRVVCGGVADLGPGERYDTIVALQVIEHVYEPVPFVRSLAERLRPGGVLVLSTPNMGSPWRRVLGRRWPSFKVPEHVVFYDNRTLPALMRRAGLEGLARIPHPHAFPASEVLGRLGLGGSARGARPVWIPGTTIAWAGRAPASPEGAGGG